MEYSCSDFGWDGMDPSPAGSRKIADQLNVFFNTDTTSRVWYLDPNPPQVNGTPFYAALDGIDDYLQVADSNSLSFGNGSADTPLTLEVWIRPESMAAKQTLISKALDGSNQEYKLYIAASSIRLDLIDTSTQAMVSAFTGNQAALAGGWHHLAVTYDGRGGAAAAAGIVFYVDGVVVPVSRINNSSYVAMENRTAPLQIGREGPSWKQYKGAIDEVRIWNAVRSQGQIQSQMLFELIGSEPGLAAYWKLNEGFGTTVADGSPMGNSAATYNGPTWVSGGPMAP
jgi:hypothetical protein